MDVVGFIYECWTWEYSREAFEITRLAYLSSLENSFLEYKYFEDDINSYYIEASKQNKTEGFFSRIFKAIGNTLRRFISSIGKIFNRSSGTETAVSNYDNWKKITWDNPKCDNFFKDIKENKKFWATIEIKSSTQAKLKFGDISDDRKKALTNIFTVLYCKNAKCGIRSAYEATSNRQVKPEIDNKTKKTVAIAGGVSILTITSLAKIYSNVVTLGKDAMYNRALKERDESIRKLHEELTTGSTDPSLRADKARLRGIKLDEDLKLKNDEYIQISTSSNPTQADLDQMEKLAKEIEQLSIERSEEADKEGLAKRDLSQQQITRPDRIKKFIKRNPNVARTIGSRASFQSNFSDVCKELFSCTGNTLCAYLGIGRIRNVLFVKKKQIQTQLQKINP